MGEGWAKYGMERLVSGAPSLGILHFTFANYKYDLFALTVTLSAIGALLLSYALST